MLNVIFDKLLENNVVIWKKLVYNISVVGFDDNSSKRGDFIEGR